MRSHTSDHYVEDEPVLNAWLVTGTLTVTYVHDPAYGADRDGNRGIPLDYEDERTWVLESATPAVGDDWGDPVSGDAVPAEVVTAALAFAMAWDVADDDGRGDDDPPDRDEDR